MARKKPTDRFTNNPYDTSGDTDLSLIHQSAKAAGSFDLSLKEMLYHMIGGMGGPQKAAYHLVGDYFASPAGSPARVQFGKSLMALLGSHGDDEGDIDDLADEEMIEQEMLKERRKLREAEGPDTC